MMVKVYFLLLLILGFSVTAIISLKISELQKQINRLEIKNESCDFEIDIEDLSSNQINEILNTIVKSKK